MNKPSVFHYHDYRAFLKDWTDYLKKTEKGFSLRSLAKRGKLSVGYLPMVFSGDRSLSAEALKKILPFLNLGPSEKSFIELLRTVAETSTATARLEALKKIQRFRSYREANPRESEVFQYLSDPVQVIIREMTALKKFKADPRWIQKRLRIKAGLAEIKRALDFLIENEFITVAGDGSARYSGKEILCLDSVYKVALGAFHKGMFEQAVESLENSQSEERQILGQTVPIRKEDFKKVKEILEHARRSISDVGAEGSGEHEVYHVTLAAFPVTRTENENA